MQLVDPANPSPPPPGGELLVRASTRGKRTSLISFSPIHIHSRRPQLLANRVLAEPDGALDVAHGHTYLVALNHIEHLGSGETHWSSLDTHPPQSVMDRPLCHPDRPGDDGDRYPASVELDDIGVLPHSKAHRGSFRRRVGSDDPFRSRSLAEVTDLLRLCSKVQVTSYEAHQIEDKTPLK